MKLSHVHLCVLENAVVGGSSAGSHWLHDSRTLATFVSVVLSFNSHSELGLVNEEMFGQRRPRMAIIVNLASNDLEAARRSKVRLASASEKLVPAQAKASRDSRFEPRKECAAQAENDTKRSQQPLY